MPVVSLTAGTRDALLRHCEVRGNMSESGSEAVAKPINLSRLHENFAATKQSGKRAENIKV